MLIARNYDSESRLSAFRHALAMRNVAIKLADTTRRPAELRDIYVALGQTECADGFARVRPW